MKNDLFSSIYPLDGLNVDDYSSKTHILGKLTFLKTFFV